MGSHPRPGRTRVVSLKSFRRLVVAATAAVLLALPASALGAQQVITSAGPLQSIYLNDSLGCQVEYTGDAHGEFFGASDPGACGTFLAVAGTVHGPTVPAGIGRTEFEPVSQSGVTGAGTTSTRTRS